MTVYVCSIKEYEAALINGDETFLSGLCDEMESYDSYQFAMDAWEIIAQGKGKISKPLYDFFRTVLWSWSDEPNKIYKSTLDECEHLIDSAIPYSYALPLNEVINSADLKKTAKDIYCPAEAFSDALELETYFKKWGQIFEKATRSNKDVIIHAQN